MSDNVHRLKAPPKMRKKKLSTPEVQNNLMELPLPTSGNITPQDLLAKLARNPNIMKVVVIFPTDDEESGGETMNVYSSNLENQAIVWLCEKGKLKTMGVIG